MLLSLLAWGKSNDLPTATVLVVAESSFAVGVRDTHLHLRHSAPQLGNVRSGYGVWEVWRSGVRIHRRVGVLDFAWPLQNGDEVWAQYVAGNGDEGGWQTHTAVVTGTVNHVQHVDTAGNDANDGLTEITAVATAYQARLNMDAVLGANQVGSIRYKRGQVHLFTAAQAPWDGSNSTVRRLVILDAYGTGARPILRRSSSANGNYSAVRYGHLDSVHLKGIEIDGQQPSPYVDSQVGVECLRFSTGARNPQNLLIEDCILRKFSGGVSLLDSRMTKGRRDNGEGDFVHIFGSQILECGSLAIFDSLCSRRVALTECQFLTTYGQSGANIHRVSNWANYSIWGCTWNPGNNGSLRMQTGRDTDPNRDIDTQEFGSISDCHFYGIDRGQNAFGWGRPAPDSTLDGRLRDIRLFNVRTYNCRLGAGGGVFNQTNGGNVIEDFQVWNCSIGGSVELMGGPAKGQLVRFEIIDCSIAMSGTDIEPGPGETWAGAQQAIRLEGRETDRYAPGSVKIRGVAIVWPVETADFQRRVFSAPRLQLDVLPSIIDSDYVHAAHVGAALPLWIDGGLNLPPEFTLQYTQTLAQWQTLTGMDANSTVRGSSNLGFTELGTHAGNQASPLMNLALSSGAGPINNLGWPRAHSIDADGKIRFATPDAGAFEFGATNEPESAPVVAGPIATGIAFLGLSSAASARLESHATGVALVGLSSSGATVATNEAQGSTFLRLSGAAHATHPVLGTAAAVIGLRGESAAISVLVIDGNGVASLSLAGAASAAVVTNAPPFGCQISNQSSAKFVGWWHVNTDLPVVEAYGQRNGVTFVRGEPSGLDTRMVSVLVDLDPGETLMLPDFVADTTNAPPTPTVPPDFFGGSPMLGGFSMSLHSTITDGQATVQEWRLRSGVWMVYLWTSWVPGEPWALCEVVILHSDPTSPSLRESWPGWLLTWGTGTVQALGRSADGSLVASGRGFGDGQCQPRPVLAWWPSRYRDAQDANSVAALLDRQVMGHAVQKQLHDGSLLERVGTAGWAASTIAGHLARLENWDEDSGGIRKSAGPPGNQGDHMFVGEEPRYYVTATRANYLAACRWGAKPCHHVEVDGRYIDLVARPTLRMFDGRPHPPTTGDMLGKPGPINPPVHSEDWAGPGMEHDLANRLDSAIRHTGSRALGWILGAKANLYNGSRFPPGFGSNSALFSTRGMLIEMVNAVHIYRDLRDRSLANSVRDRVQVRLPIYSAWLYPSHGYPQSYWEVFTATSASVTNVPGYIPFQQGPCAYFINLANRVFGGLSSLNAAVVAGAYQVLNDVWIYEFDPTFGVERWVEYERVQLPKPWGEGIRERSGQFSVAWFPPLIALIRRLDPASATANAIWSQMLAQLGGGGQWMPPSGEEVAVDYVRGAGIIGISGAASATVETMVRQANGVAVLGLSGTAAAEVGPIPPAARGRAFLGLSSTASADVSPLDDGPPRRLRRPYWLWLWRSFRR